MHPASAPVARAQATGARESARFDGRIGKPALASELARLLAYRWLVALCQAATVLLTWQLWADRPAPPLLPLVAAPSIDFGPPLLVSLALAAVVGAPGAWLHAGLLAWAIAVDQTRLQPEAISLAILLLAAAAGPGARLVGRAHLVALWFWAGAGKLLSPAFVGGVAPRLVAGWWPEAPGWVGPAAGVAVALAEMTLGVLALVPATRRLVGWDALALHGGILLAFLPLLSANLAVWPWNVALAAAGFALVAPWRGRFRAALAAAPLPARVVAVALLLIPAGYPLGLTDAYLAHRLYTGDTATAAVACPAGCRPEQDPNATWAMLGVPLPPEPRLYRASFQQTCARGDALRIVDPVPGPWGAPVEIVSCARDPAPPAYPSANPAPPGS